MAKTAKIGCWANGGPGRIENLGASPYKDKGHACHWQAASDSGSGTCRVMMLPKDLRLLAQFCLEQADLCEQRNAAYK